MFTVIGIMFGGIAVGYLLRKVELLQKIGKPISYTILLLLFLLGISVGANDAIVNNLTTLGGQAFLIALAGTTGGENERESDCSRILRFGLYSRMERVSAGGGR